MVIYTELIIFIALVLVLISMLVLLRSHVVFMLRTRLLQEESIWLQLHRDEIDKGQPPFERYLRLPSYTAMLLKFWKTMGSFEREVGSIEQYYLLLK
ncbi:hypothetical protein LCGC14_0262330 [marine sediment metagenome]|uniref:Uncharacterized protein n=1 Tax=marine sediment metagenome TaxID=412755 RepID=A0A0F9U5T2_9ZZZZ